MIVKNEAGGLEKAVESARPFVNEIVIGVDSKSTDSTLKIAKELADICYIFDWEDNYAKTRNEGLEKTSGEWNFVMDGHEYVTQYPEFDLLEVEDDVDSLRVKLTMENGEVVSTGRILRNHVRFKNATHNVAVTKKAIIVHDLKMIHDRRQQSKEAIEARNKQRIRMNEKDMNDDTFRSHWYLGQLYRGSKVKKSIKHYRRAIELGKNANKEAIRAAHFYLGQMLYKDGQLREALKAVKGDSMEYGYLRGMIYFREENFSKATIHFLEALNFKKMKEASRPVDDLEFEIYDHLSQCFYKLKQSQIARTTALLALTYKEDKRVRENAEIFVLTGLAKEEKGADYYDRVFSDEQNDKKYGEIRKVAINLLVEIEDPKILEIGCGGGRLAKEILDIGLQYRGFDFSKKAIENARKICKTDKEFVIGNAYDKKMYEGDYNTVIAIEVLEHVDDLKVLSNIKSGVAFIGSVPTFGDAAHLRIYKEKQADIVDRFSKYLAVEKVLFSQQSGIYIIKGMTK